MNFKRTDLTTNESLPSKPTGCANCGAELSGKYCSQCGQSVKEMRRSFWKVLLSFWGEGLSLDGQFYHTIKPLFLRPWVLTQDFMDGKRVRYTPPFRMYLFVSFFAFLLIGFSYQEDEADLFSGVVISPNDTISKKDSLVLNPEKKSDVRLELGSEADSDWAKRIQRGVQRWQKSPAFVMELFLKKTSQMLFVVFPFFALFLSLFFYSKKYYFLEHFLLSLNFHSFIFLVFILGELIDFISFGFLTDYLWLLFLLIPIQMYRILKNYYQQSFVSIFLKFLSLSLLHMFLLSVGLFSSFFISLL